MIVLSNGPANPVVVATTAYGPILVNQHDERIGASILHTGYWAREEIGLMHGYLQGRLKQRGHIIVYDIGANIGTHTLAMAQAFGARITIRAFEAQRYLMNMLCGTLALNNLENVHCHLNAVADVAGEAIPLHPPDYARRNNFGGLELIPPRASDNQDMIKSDRRETVWTTTLDQFDEPVDFIKLDIEGMEDKALRGGKGTIDRHRPACLIEIDKTDTEFVLSFIARRGYRGYLVGNNLMAIPSEQDMDMGDALRIC